MKMTRSRRIDIPNPTGLRGYLEQENDPTVRLRLILLNLIAELPRSLSLAQICAMVDVPEPTAYVWVRAWRERGYQGDICAVAIFGRPDPVAPGRACWRSSANWASKAPGSATRLFR